MHESELLSLTERFPTPFYLFDGKELERRVAHLRAVLPPDTGLCYAVKANPFLAQELGGWWSGWRSAPRGSTPSAASSAWTPASM